MITKSNFKDLLKKLGFTEDGNIFQKSIGEADLTVDFSKQRLIYPPRLIVNREDTCNFSQNENFVVYECIHRLLDKGYKPEHLELEPTWRIGHSASGGRADILVRDHENHPLLIIECKTAGDEFERAWRKTLQNGDQLFSYAQQIQQTQYLCLYASDFENNKIHPDQRIIAHRDNEKIVAQNETLRRFSEATDVEDRYAVWRDTYELECTESGIFEENIQTYQIGKNKYTLEADTKPIDATDAKKDGKFHKFRTILRKHNIARREQAFEVLVNLFLCKLVDEEDNKTDLQFSWKGIAYDNYYDYIDRLQNLYQTGMGKFLGKNISYVSNKEIDDAFWAVRNDTNATKKQIQKYFRELKFFTNSAFSLQDTHNEELFKRNAKVLLEIVQMWQGIRLKTDAQNPFLGEMFELFLDDGVKQSEGQFFTPLPICKFIVGSLPLKQKIEENPEPLKVIDYACGSGHFLNEYAYQIKPLVEKQERDRYYSHITGIEKEDRLAKVAKVAAYMHGQEQIKILDTDALASHPDRVPLESFDVLVANPPFAVKEFLHTLSKDDKKQYQLIKATGEDSDTNTIQCFFLERIHHLMAPDGVVGVIVPSSILSNADAVHIQTREILLQYFDLVCIAEMGSGTFGKTGTNTVVLFLRRKNRKPEVAEHYRNRVNGFFQGDHNNAKYKDDYLIKAYCHHIEISYEEYINLFAQTSLEPLSELLQYDIFQDYKQAFSQSTDIKNLKKSNVFKKKTATEQSAELEQRFIAYLHTIENEKLYYFILAYTQAGKVLIVNTPKNKKERDRFLGYKWSEAKGREGIQYNDGDTVNDIITPLFDPKDLDNDTKINTAIKRNFIGEITNPLPEQCQYAKFTDMLDFSRTDFNKSINLNPQQNTDIETKWERKTIHNLLREIDGHTTQIQESDILQEGETAVITQEQDLLISGYTDKKETITDVPLIIFGDHSCTFKYIDFPFIRGADGTQLLKVDENELIPKYFYYLLQLVEIPNSDKYERHFKYLKNLKIPLPLLTVQQQIVNECEGVDQETDEARETITASKQKIEELVSSVEKTSRLNQVVDRISDIVNPKEENGVIHYVGLKHIESQTGTLLGDIQSDFSMIKSNKNVFHGGDILYGKLRPNLNKVHLANIDGICSTDILVLRPHNPNLATFYKYYFLSTAFNSEVVGTVSGQQLPRTSWEKIERILVPSSDVQRQLVIEVEQLEAKITEAQAVINNATARKNDILKKYL